MCLYKLFQIPGTKKISVIADRKGALHESLFKGFQIGMVPIKILPYPGMDDQLRKGIFLINP